MIILDTNVFSEPMKPHADPAVEMWLDRQVAETTYFTSTSLAELLFGVELLPKGKKRQGIATAINLLIEQLFGPRILSFDRQAAVLFAELLARARKAGCTVSINDGQIAAIAQVHGFMVATRDIKPFKAMGVAVINPWEQ